MLAWLCLEILPNAVPAITSTWELDQVLDPLPSIGVCCSCIAKGGPKTGSSSSSSTEVVEVQKSMSPGQVGIEKYVEAANTNRTIGSSFWPS